MSVESWNPAGVSVTLTAAVVERLCRAATSLDAPGYGLDPAEIADFAVFARDGGAGSAVDWSARAEALDDEQLVALIRLFTLAEMALSAWKGAERSPVIALAAQLKRRGALPAGLTAWIRSNSDNRFLPYGSLLDRL
jgi:hypothetical protein